jgi:holo-[acyl-carrier protein] synthase
VTELVNGIDIIEIHRVKSIADRYGQRFFKRIYTNNELAYCRGRAPQLASRFAAKEAVMKALGTGTRGVRWRDIEVVRLPGMAPSIKLYGSALVRAENIGINHLSLSLSHSKEYAVASVVCESTHGNLIQ